MYKVIRAIRERATTSLSVVSGRLHPFDEAQFDLLQLPACLSVQPEYPGNRRHELRHSTVLGIKDSVDLMHFLGSSLTILKYGR